jgi:hypothetical protein
MLENATLATFTPRLETIDVDVELLFVICQPQPDRM